MKYFFQLAFLSLLSLAIINACNNNTSKTDTTTDSTMIYPDNTTDTSMAVDTSKSMDPMNMTMERMKGLQMTGDFDIDFANMMIEHHQGGIEMSEQEIRNGKDESLKTMAKKIIDDQNKEISQLRDFVKTYKASGMKHGEGELHKSMQGMQSMMGSMSKTGDQDKDFAMNMTMHHQHGIDMAKMQLQHGMSAELKKMAQAIIDKQTKEIAELKKWTSTH